MICTAIGFFVHIAAADTPNIVGAFGFKFGDTLSDEAKVNCTDDVHCSVTPQTPYYAFSKYQVHLTERKRRIHQIIGLGHPESFFQCNAYADNISRILERKYEISFEASEYVAPNGILMNTWKVTIGTPPTGLWALESEVTDTTESITILCHDASGTEAWKSGGTHLDVSPVNITITYKSNAVISQENFELRIDERGL